MSAECRECGSDLVYRGDEMFCQVCELRRERDEALAELEREQESCDKSAGLLLKAERERDEARALLTRLLSSGGHVKGCIAVGGKEGCVPNCLDARALLAEGSGQPEVVVGDESPASVEQAT